MGAVLHCRVCKGCLIQHSHSHLHSHGGGAHSHNHHDGRHRGSHDDVLLPISSVSTNGFQPLLAESRSDIQLLVNGDDDDVWQPAECTVQQPHDTTNVNIRAAMVHVIGDLIQSVGVFTAAIIVLVKVCYSQSV